MVESELLTFPESSCISFSKYAGFGGKKFVKAPPGGDIAAGRIIDKFSRTGTICTRKNASRCIFGFRMTVCETGV
jgi:hypothetical protein